MNYYEKDDLRFEALKGVKMHDKLEYENEEACAKDTLTNVEVKNKKCLLELNKDKVNKKTMY